jgi:hypothetical protein
VRLGRQLRADEREDLLFLSLFGFLGLSTSHDRLLANGNANERRRATTDLVTVRAARRLEEIRLVLAPGRARSGRVFGAGWPHRLGDRAEQAGECRVVVALGVLVHVFLFPQSEEVWFLWLVMMVAREALLRVAFIPKEKLSKKKIVRRALVVSAERVV